MDFNYITNLGENLEISLAIKQLDNLGLLLICLTAIVIAFMFFKFKSK
ncbi:hypothetical protein QYB58_003047 [Clostridium perfringens]|nr:hypothetical protein [Clostridium perfringens]ELC8457861.1 hypothetical protein [Clostridium perfringens]